MSRASRAAADPVVAADRPGDGGLRLRELVLEAGEIAVEPGQPCRGAFLIEDGKVEVYRKSGERKIVVAVLGRGDIFGEMALVEGVPHVRWVRALEPTTCLLISREQFAALQADTPPIVRLFLARVVRKLRRTTDVAFGR